MRFGMLRSCSVDNVTVTGDSSRDRLALKAVPFSDEVKAMAKSEAKLVITGNAKDGFTITNAKVKSPDPTDSEYPENPENPEDPEGAIRTWFPCVESHVGRLPHVNAACGANMRC